MNGDGIIRDGIIDDNPLDLGRRWPTLWQKAEGAIGQLAAPVMACSHVIDGEHPMLCADHPQARFLCIRMLQDHSGKMHDPE